MSRPGRLDRPIQSLASGRYVISGVLGSGGMATVFRAFDTRLDLQRAVKVLNPELVSSPSLRKRFEMEARTMARLHHPNIVSVFDIGVEDELAFMVMELLEGGSLNDRIKNVGYLPPRSALSAIAAILSALVVAHNKGVIHRDIKPHNVMLTHDGLPKLTDFGIAHLIGQDKALTASNAVIGTWAFMAPEQRKSSRRVSVQTDIYSVGATLYALLTARDPFDIYNKELQKELFAGIPEPIVEVIERATRYYPDERYPTAADMLAAIQRVDAAIRPDFLDAPSKVLPLVELSPPPSPSSFLRPSNPTLASVDTEAGDLGRPRGSTQSPTLYPAHDTADYRGIDPNIPELSEFDLASTDPGERPAVQLELLPPADADEEPTPFGHMVAGSDPMDRLRRAATRVEAPPSGLLSDPVAPPPAGTTRRRADRDSSVVALRPTPLRRGLGPVASGVLLAVVFALLAIVLWSWLRPQPTPPPVAVTPTDPQGPTDPQSTVTPAGETSTTQTVGVAANPVAADPVAADPVAADPVGVEPAADPPPNPTTDPDATTGTDASTPLPEDDVRERLKALPGQ